MALSTGARSSGLLPGDHREGPGGSCVVGDPHRVSRLQGTHIGQGTRALKVLVHVSGQVRRRLGRTGCGPRTGTSRRSGRPWDLQLAVAVYPDGDDGGVDTQRGNFDPNRRGGRCRCRRGALGLPTTSRTPRKTWQ